MTQFLRNQTTSVAEKNKYHWQPSSEEHKLHRSPNKRSRSRGIVLSRQGWQKLRQAGVLNDEFGDRYTYEQLSEQSHLDERTVSRLLSCEVKVDKSTLKTFFNAFNLSLEAGDYTFPNSSVSSSKTSSITAQPAAQLTSKVQSAEVEQLLEELSYLKQRMRECERRFHLLGLNEASVNQQLGA